MTTQPPIKAVILAGGRGSRLAEETSSRPKPMVEIGGYPILWHIMKTYSHHGINDFVICCGYLGYRIKEYFFNYYLHHSDVTLDLHRGMTVHGTMSEDWRITLIDTGLETQTGGRLKRVREHVADAEFFCLTYGDGVGDIDIRKSLAFHQSHGKLATVTAVTPAARFGALVMDGGDQVAAFEEKPSGDNNRINGGYFVLSPKVIDLIAGDATLWEREPMETLARQGELMAFRHRGFWQPMDTLRDRQTLEALWATGAAPWKCW